MVNLARTDSRYSFDQRASRAAALADIYVKTNGIRRLLEERLQAIQQALYFGASQVEIRDVMEGLDGDEERQEEQS